MDRAQRSSDLCAFFMDYDDLYLEQTDSTNLQARKLAAQDAVHGTGVLADSQTSGRGRLAREWFSPSGKNLYCSFILRPLIDPEDYAKLTMVAGLAVARYLNTLIDPQVGLKWPNDLHIRGKKCGGILCESSLDGGEQNRNYAIVGIGLNLNIEQIDLPEHLQETATSLFIETGRTYEVRALFNGVRGSLLRCVGDFERRGFLHILEQWKTFDTTQGRLMTWITSDKKKVCGRSLGPDESGFLQVQDGHGELHRVISGDVNLARKGDDS